MYTSHPDIYTILEKAFGKDNPQLKQVLWEINKAALEAHIAKGMVFDYSLSAVARQDDELFAIKAIVEGKWDKAVGIVGDRARMREIKQLVDSGYRPDFSDLANDIIHWVKP